MDELQAAVRQLMKQLALIEDGHVLIGLGKVVASRRRMRGREVLQLRQAHVLHKEPSTQKKTHVF